MIVTFEVNTNKDNDSVLDDAICMLANDGERGHDALVDSLNGAWDDDVKLVGGARKLRACGGRLGRGKLREALELMEQEHCTEEDKQRAKWLLLLGIAERALAFSNV